MGINAITMVILAAAGIGTGGGAVNYYADPYWANVVSRCKYDDANGAVTANDSSQRNSSFSITGGSIITSDVKFGSGAMLLNSNPSY